MHRPISYFVSAVALVVSAGACTSSAHVATPRANTVDTHTVNHRVPNGTKLHVHFTGSGPLPALLTPVCKGQQCVVPATETGAYHGDIEGTHVTAGGTVTLGVHFVSARADLVTGTVKGCGTGTFVLISTEEATPTAGTGTGDIAVGYGTGDLAHLSGHVSGTGTVGADGIHTTYEGDLFCKKAT